MLWISKSSKEKSVRFYTATGESSHLYADVLYALHVWGMGVPLYWEMVVWVQSFPSAQSGLPVS